MKTLDALSPAERQHAQDIVNHVYSSPGVPLPAWTDLRVLKVLVEVGVIDYSKITTTMLYEDASPNSQPPPIDRWKTKYGTFVEPGPPPVITATWS